MEPAAPTAVLGDALHQRKSFLRLTNYYGMGTSCISCNRPY